MVVQNNRSCSQYASDYEALTPLKVLADTYHVSLLAVHHLRKMGASDMLDEITGSTGVTGAVDGTLILKRERGQAKATLFVTGRDVEQEQHLALSFDATTALWTLEGNAEEVGRTRERQEILDLLTEQLPDGMCPREIAAALDKNYHTTRSLLRKMEEAGDIMRCQKQYIARREEQRRSPSPPPSASSDAINYADGKNASTVSVAFSAVTNTSLCAEETRSSQGRHEIRSPEQHEQEDLCDSNDTNVSIVSNRDDSPRLQAGGF